MAPRAGSRGDSFFQCDLRRPADYDAAGFRSPYREQERRLSVRNRSTVSRRSSATVLGGGLVLLALAVVLPSGVGLAEETPAKTLYERMGGYDVMSGIVDDFLMRLGDDAAFKRFGGGRSKDSLGRTKQLIKDQFCSLTGGPCAYTGRDMKTSHEGLEITQAEWDSMMVKLNATLDKFKIGETEKNEFVALIEKTRKDIVEKTEAEQPKAEN